MDGMIRIPVQVYMTGLPAQDWGPEHAQAKSKALPCLSSGSSKSTVVEYNSPIGPTISDTDTA